MKNDRKKYNDISKGYGKVHECDDEINPVSCYINIVVLFMITSLMLPITASADPFTYQTYGAQTDIAGQTGAYDCGAYARTSVPFSDTLHVINGGDNYINMYDSELLTTAVSSVSLIAYADVSQNMLIGNVSTYSGQCNLGPVGGEGYASSMIYDNYTITSSSLATGTPINIGFNWKLNGRYSNPSIETGNVYFQFSIWLTFKFPSGIKIKYSEVHRAIRNVWTKRDKFDTIKGYLYQKLSCRPVNRQNLMECLTHKCKLNES